MPPSVADRFYIEGSRHARPDAARVIYADGAGTGRIRPDVDTELSHWVPNRTDAEYKADSSTEICLNYAASASRRAADLVVNDHADVDGILALYSLLESDTALAHRDTLIAAAEMGDFVAWADRPAFRLAQELCLMLSGGPARPADLGDCYAEAMKITTGVLEGTRPEAAAIATGWAVIERGCEELARGVVRVDSITDRLVSFVYPIVRDVEAALRIPILNAVVDDAVWMWPQVRNREHLERVQLVSVPASEGWFHDVWVPSYAWADTPNRWPLPGLVSTGDSNQWIVDHAPLRHAAAELNGIETAPGRWVTADRLTPWNTVAGRAFPVVLSFLADTDDQPAPSSLRPERVAQLLAPVWP